jgi:hypothetical protein
LQSFEIGLVRLEIPSALIACAAEHNSVCALAAGVTVGFGKWPIW